MCMVFYLGSEQPIPRIPWSEAKPDFNVLDIPEDAAAVLRHFSLPYVCFVGSWEGCGCGFQSSEFVEYDDPDDLAMARKQRAILSEFLRAALSKSVELQLYACWSGDESKDVESNRDLVPEKLLREHEHFREREMLRVLSK